MNRRYYDLQLSVRENPKSNIRAHILHRADEVNVETLEFTRGEYMIKLLYPHLSSDEPVDLARRERIILEQVLNVLSDEDLREALFICSQDGWRICSDYAKLKECHELKREI